MEDDISAVSIAPSHFRQVLTRAKTKRVPRARIVPTSCPSPSSPIGGSGRTWIPRSLIGGLVYI